MGEPSEKTDRKAGGHFTCKEQHLHTHGVLVTFAGAAVGSVKQLKQGFVLAHGWRVLRREVLQQELEAARYIVLSQEAERVESSAQLHFFLLFLSQGVPFLLN